MMLLVSSRGTDLLTEKKVIGAAAASVADGLILTQSLMVLTISDVLSIAEKQVAKNGSTRSLMLSTLLLRKQEDKLDLFTFRHHKLLHE